MLNKEKQNNVFVGARTGTSPLLPPSGHDGNTLKMLTDEEAGTTMLKGMNNIQDDTKTSLQRTKQMIASSKQTGEMTLEEQLAQRKQIRQIAKEINRADESLTRSYKLIRKFRILSL